MVNKIVIVTCNTNIIITSVEKERLRLKSRAFKVQWVLLEDVIDPGIVIETGIVIGIGKEIGEIDGEVGLEIGTGIEIEAEVVVLVEIEGGTAIGLVHPQNLMAIK